MPRRDDSFFKSDSVRSAEEELAFAGTVPSTRSIATTAPVQGGGTLAADRTISVLNSTATNTGAGDAGKLLKLDANGKAAGRVLETDGAKLDALPASMASPGAIGGTTPAAGAFTTLSASGALTASAGVKLLGAAPAAAADQVSHGVADINGATTAAHHRIFEGGGADVSRVMSAAATIKRFSYFEAAVADDAEVSLPAPATLGRVRVTSYDEEVVVAIKSDGTCTLLYGSTNVDDADTDTKLCVYNASGNPKVKNRLGGARDLLIEYQAG